MAQPELEFVNSTPAIPATGLVMNEMSSRSPSPSKFPSRAIVASLHAATIGGNMVGEQIVDERVPLRSPRFDCPPRSLSLDSDAVPLGTPAVHEVIAPAPRGVWPRSVRFPKCTRNGSFRTPNTHRTVTPAPRVADSPCFRLATVEPLGNAEQLADTGVAAGIAARSHGARRRLHVPF